MQSMPIYRHCCSGRGAQHYVIKFVSDLRQVGGFLRFPPPIKLTDITEILLKVALNTIKPRFNKLLNLLHTCI